MDIQRINTIISKRPVINVADFIAVAKQIQNQINLGTKKEKPAIKIAFLCSFTTNGIGETLFTKCCSAGILPEIYICEYGQYAQEILSPSSKLYQFAPNLIIFFLDTQTILCEKFLVPYKWTDSDRRIWADEKLSEILNFINILKKKTKALILLHNFNVPFYSPLGILENKQTFGLRESVEVLNTRIRDEFKKDNSVFILDYDSFCARKGKERLVDYKLYYLGDFRLDLQLLPALCDIYLIYIKQVVSVVKKCLVLDLDNTLWGGILGEDGFEKINIGPTGEGKPFTEFQTAIFSLYLRGIILAINSKNNLDEVMQVLQKHPSMVLRDQHFSAMRINWDDKVANMKSLSKELNISLESFVFFDDDKRNREIVKNALPEVLVMDVPEDPALYVKTLMEFDGFNSLQFTAEDGMKGQAYAQQRKRKELKNSTSDIGEYLKQLETRLTIKKGDSFNIPRIAQLTQKTNQFNMTTKRYTENDIYKFSLDEQWLVLSIKVEDKFGDNGITGAVLVEKDRSRWIIDLFLLSCRVLGRGIEDAIFSYLVESARKTDSKVLIGKFIPSGKNMPAKDFYRRSGFKFLRLEAQTEYWEYLTSAPYKFPEYITLTHNSNI